MFNRFQFAIDNKTFAGFIFILIILTSIEWLSFQTTNELIQNTKLVNQTHTILTKLELVFSTLKDAESGQRGYMLTNDSVYMDHYKKDKIIVGNEVDELKNLIDDKPEHVQQIEQLDSLVKERNKRMEVTLQYHDMIGQRAAMELLMTKQEYQIMDKIRNLIDTMKNDENQQLA